MLRLVRKDLPDLQFGRISSLEPLMLPQGYIAWDILLAGLDFPGLQWKLQNGGIRCPVVVLADPALESDALELLEAGQISDYILTSRSQMKRLPWVLKAALARVAFGEIGAPTAQRGVLQEAIYQIAEGLRKSRIAGYSPPADPRDHWPRDAGREFLYRPL